MSNIHNQQVGINDINTNYGVQTDGSASSAAAKESQEAAPNAALLQADHTQHQQMLAKLAQSDASDDGKTRTMQRFFAQNDSTGSGDGDELHGKMAKAAKGMGLPSVSKTHMHAIAMRVSNHPATRQMAAQVKDVMQGKGALPDHKQMAAAAGSALGDTHSFGASTGEPQNVRSGTIKLAGAASDDMASAATPEDASGATDASASAGTNAASANGTAAPTASANESGAGSASTAQGTSKAGASDPSDPHNFKAVAAAVRNGTVSPSQVAGDVIGFVYAVMMQAQIDGNKDKREELNHTQMLNGMSDALSEYMSKVLVPAQERVSSATAKASKDQRSNPDSITTVVEPVMDDVNTNYGLMNTQTGQYQLMAQYDSNGGRKQVDQNTLNAMNSQVQQWQQSIQNNQTKQTNRFQATDSAQTSNMNIINSLLKSVHDATNNIVHNLQT